MSTMTRQEKDSTPAVIRRRVTVLLVVAAALLAGVSLVFVRAQEQARVLGEVAAPQAAAAADLYFALSDLDAQVARMVLIDDADELAGSQIDALGTYRERSAQADADLAALLSTADRDQVLALTGALATYREWVWQALTAGPVATAGFYTQATNVLHLQLLPGAQAVRDTSVRRLDQAYTERTIIAVTGIALALLIGGALLVLLFRFQAWLARRFRRTLNPALLAATVITLGLTLSAAVVLGWSTSRLGTARSESLDPYLALSQTRAVSYDAAADTSRYLISGGLAYYRADFTAKSGSLRAPAEVLERWTAYQRDHERIVALADTGQRADAISLLTGIRRGDAAFDFSFYDAAIGAAATGHRQDFETSFAAGSGLLTGWVAGPVVAMLLVMALIPLGVRARLAEYRG